MSYEERDFWGDAIPAPQEETKTQSKNKLIIIGLIAVFAIFSTAGFLVASRWLGGPGIASPPEEGTPGVVTEPEKDSWMNILLLGTDQRANEPARSDTIILVFLNTDTKDIKLMSIPRDTYAKIPGRGYEKLGHANAYGGPKRAVEAVEDLLDMKIDHYVELNFDGFKQMVDVLGGIEIEVEKRMYNPEEDIDLYPGEQKLNGYDALAYVRYRSDADGNDIGRIKRQQKFLKVLAEETFQLSTILKLPGIVKEANKSIRTDFSLAEMLSLASGAKSYKVEEMETATLPGTPKYIDQLSYWVPDKEETKKLIDRFLNPPKPETVAEQQGNNGLTIVEQ